MKNVLVAAKVDSEEVSLARKIWADIYSESQGGKPDEMFLEDKLLLTGYSHNIEGPAKFYICFVPATEFQHTKFTGLIEKHKLVEQCPSFSMEKIVSKLDFLQDNDLHEVS